MVNPEALSNPELLQVMRAVTEHAAPGGAAAVGAMLLEATLLVPGLESETDGEIWPAGLARPDGQWDFVCFTDLAAARAWDPDRDTWAGVIGSELIDYVLASGGVRLILNSSGPFGGAFDRLELQRLSARPRRPDFDRLRAPTSPLAPHLRERLGGLVEQIPGIEAVYALEADSPGAEPHALLGLTLDERANPDWVAAAVDQSSATC